MPERKPRKLPKPGSTFKRDYHGETYSLSVVEQKGRVLYRLQGETFNSPTAAAKSLTKYAVNGWAFWKMDKS